MTVPATFVRLLLLSALAAAPNLAAQDSGHTTDSISFASNEVELRGAIYLPPGAPPFPAVFFLHGGGNGWWLNSEPDDFARMVVDRGIAALVYHKRGTGTSGGDWAHADFDDLIADAGAAYRYLAGRPDILADKVAVVGFSQGGRLAPVVAARSPLAAAVSVSGPAVSPAATRLYALENSMRENGLTDEQVATALVLWRSFFEALSQGDSLGRLDPAIAEAARSIPPRALPPISSQYRPMPHYNSLDFDPTADLRRLRAPFLALFGELDVTVPVEPSIAALNAALPTSGRDEVAIRVLPGASHSLDRPPGTRHPDYVPTVLNWLDRYLMAP